MDELSDANQTGLSLFILFSAVWLVAGGVARYRGELSWSFSVALIQATLFPIAIIPQLIINEQDKNIDTTYSPFFVVVYPASVVADIITVFFSTKWVVTTTNIINMVGMVTRLILYTAWLMQFALYSSAELQIVMWLFVVGFMIIVIVTCVLAYNRYRAIPDQKMVPPASDW